MPKQRVTQPAPANLAVAYARVSSREQEKEGYSIPAQIKLIEEYAQTNGFELVTVYSEAETAKQSGREEFNKMLHYLAKEGKLRGVKTILVEKTDRLYRNFKDYVALEELDVAVHFIKEGEILSKESRSHVKFIHGIKVLMAKNYIDNLSEEIKKGLNEKAAQGHYPLIAPYGYKNNKETRQLDIDPEESKFVQRAFELYATGHYSLKVVREMLFNEGFRFIPSKAKINVSSLDIMLKNIIYTGDFIYKGQFYRGKHAPIIPISLFEKVQEAYRKANKPKQVKRDFLFAGLLTCGHCGCSVSAQIKKGKYVYYHCSGAKGNCGEKYVREEVIAEQFEEAVRRISPPERLVNLIVPILKASHQQEKDFHEERVETLERRHTQLRHRLEQMYEDKLDNKIPETLWIKKSSEYKKEMAHIEASIAQHNKGNLDYIDCGVQLLELAKNAFSLYVRQSGMEKRRLLDFLLSNCTLKGGKVSYDYKKPFNTLLEPVVLEKLSG
jgi:site-specific DNA recombinase